MERSDAGYANLITEFFFDGISRIIPGFVVLQIFQICLPIFFTEIPIFNYEAVEVFFYILTAWFIGLVVDTISFWPIIFFLKRKCISNCFSHICERLESSPCKNCFLHKSAHYVIQKLILHDKWLLPAAPNYLQVADERKTAKLFAEATLFRSLTFIFFATCIAPKHLTNIPWKESLSIMILCLILYVLTKYACNRLVSELDVKSKELKEMRMAQKAG